MGSRQATGNMFRSLIKPLTPCIHQAPFIICSFYTLYIYTFRRPLPTLCWMMVSEEEEPVMLAGRLLFSSWTLVGSEMGFASQALGSFHLIFRSLSDCHLLIVGLPNDMRWTTSHLLPSGVPAAGYQREEKEGKAACSPLCHVPKVNIRQDRTHGFASLFFPLTLHPAAVQRTGNASRLITSVSLTFYPMADSAAEVSEYLLAYPPLSFHAWAVIMLIGILILLVYPLLSFYPPVVNEAEKNETNSRLSPTIALPAGSQRSGRERNKLSSIPHYRSTRW